MSDAPAPDVSTPQATPSESAPAQPSSDKRKVKIDGVETEVDVNEVLNDYNKYRAADKRFEEAAKLRKEAEGAFESKKQIEYLLENATKGDLAWLKQIVPKDVLTKWAEKELLDHIEWERLPEAEKRAHVAEQRAKELEDKINEIAQTKERQEASVVEERAYQQIEADIIESVKSLGHDVKVTPRFIRRISEQMLASLEASGNDPNVKFMPAKVATERAFRGLKVDAQELLSLLPPEEVIKMLPQKIRDAVRRADVDQALSQMPRGVRKSEMGDDPKPRPSKFKRMSTDDYFDRLEQAVYKKR